MSEEPNIQIHNLIARHPDEFSLAPYQWLHHQCEGNLQISNDGTISCEKCGVKQPASTWCITDNKHLSESPPEVKPLDFPALSALAGQLASTAGPQWLKEFLSNIED
ncbi:hypothetical protein AM228_04145 [Planktothricoides sp. SR001]|uniref:hypothetical protein n=1 Tax=Planktothricoides sp. SR001 TaxID=1705388 RepID=UPI0006BF330F|nr:hypothetical protein [Planktothricoides sp. SR001]KOR37981.1 hypothetical protein AM228_04145 [Planktothricoides sp. SR001]